MRILGIDPGTAITGFGIIDKEGNKLKVKDFGVIRTKAHEALDVRLKIIYTNLTELIKIHSPDFFSVEELFFNNNAKTALSVGHARGVVVLAAALHDKPVFEYTPLQVKQAVVGYGRADKNQVQQMVKTLLNLEKIPKPDDAADALAIAICHAHSHKLKERGKNIC